MNTSSSNIKDERFKYYGTAGKDFPRFDVKSSLPKEVEPTPRYESHVGLQALPTLSLFSFLDWLFSKVGRFRTMTGKNLQEWMPANLSRLLPDKFKFSDEYFVERRLNGFNPGKLNYIEGEEWQYAVNYNTRQYQAEPGGLLPKYSEARFILSDRALKVHSIQYCLKDQTITCSPTDGKVWEYAKYIFRSVEYVFQEIQSHLGRTHMNMDQYAMAFYRNISNNNPLHQLLLPHFEGLLSIDKRGASLIIGNKGFIPEASALDPKSVDEVLIDEIASLTYRWSPEEQKLRDTIDNNHFDRAALAMWELLEKYVAEFFTNNQQKIQTYWSEIEGMSEDLVTHSIFKGKETLAIKDQKDLQQLCVYVIYHCTFFHSWVNNKQYEDGGDIEYAAIGLWDKDDPNYDQKKVDARHDRQVQLMWTLANVHYNPAIEFAPYPLKKLLWEYRDRIEPGIPLGWIMMSINI